MHGSLMYGCKQFVKTRYGESAWQAIASSIGATDEGWYVVTKVYPDEELASLIRATSAHAGVPQRALLEEFGASLVAPLMSLYGALVDPGWRTFDLLANTEQVIHRAVRIRDRAAAPPHLRVQRISEGEVHIEYLSERRLCALAVGICRGVGAHFGEAITVEQPRCTERGDASCLIVVTSAASE